MRLHLHLIVAILIFVSILAGGAYTYHQVEGWSKLDSAYFTVVTVTTIGYGDLAPKTSTGKIFTMFFAFLGVATALYFLSTISSYLFKEHVDKKVDQIKNRIENKYKKIPKKELKKKQVKK